MLTWAAVGGLAAVWWFGSRAVALVVDTQVEATAPSEIGPISQSPWMMLVLWCPVVGDLLIGLACEPVWRPGS